MCTFAGFAAESVALDHIHARVIDALRFRPVTVGSAPSRLAGLWATSRCDARGTNHAVCEEGNQA